MLDIRNTLLKCGAKENISLSSVTSMHIGGPAAYFIETDNAQTIIAVYEACVSSHLPIALIGNGTNLLCPDKGFDGVIVKMKKSERLPDITNGSFTAFAGDSLTQIANFTVKKGFSGFERLAGIPGTVGGAVAMNAGAYGGETKDVLKRVHLIQNGQDRWMDVEANMLGYRKSPFIWPECIVLEAEFHVLDGDGTEAKVMEDCLQMRREKQPLEYPSAGSVFKRPTGFYAGTLIEKAGLKGYRIGGAEISQKHAGFIINKGGATEKDVMDLIDHVQNTVFKQFGVVLEREVLRLEEIACTY